MGGWLDLISGGGGGGGGGGNIAASFFHFQGSGVALAMVEFCIRLDS